MNSGLPAQLSPGLSEEQATDEVARLEAELEALAESLERCRKIALVSKLVIVGGAIGVLAAALGFLVVYPAALVGALAALIGGVVVHGSNATTAAQAMEAMQVAEGRRAALISAMSLRLVGD